MEELDQNDDKNRQVPPHSWLNRTVIGVGVTSALGDFCYETTTVILPGFLAVLGIPAAVLGTIEGLADAVASFTKMVSGYIADKLGHRKQLVLVGYALGRWIALCGTKPVIAGLYMAVQEALESTVTAGMVPQDMLGTSLGALGTINGTAKFISSASVGVLWTTVSPVFSFGLASALMMLGTFLLYQLRTDSRNGT